ncbi:MAG TPA: amidohydrolase family protein [Phycisphaerae bacterium]|nr:amidohydrolase family protein [Phycisphaerae bacterium]
MSNQGRIEDCIRQGLPLADMPVVDFHTHIAAGSAEYYYIPKSSPENIIASMNRYGVDMAVTFPITQASDVNCGNRAQYDIADAHPERFFALSMLHAGFPEDWIKILEEGYRRGSRGIKLISQYQQRDEAYIDWTAAFDFARDRNWVVLHHDWGGVDRLTRWAEAYPEIIFIIGHASIEYKAVVERYPNVFQNTCACFVSCIYPSAQKMLDNLPDDKILYGSDALDLEFGTGIGPIAFALASEETKQKILGRNALRIMHKLGWRIPPILQKYV